MKAVVFVDVQNDFIVGALRNEKAIEVTPKIVEFAKECVDKGYKLYATRDTHKKTEAVSYTEHGWTGKTDDNGKCIFYDKDVNNKAIKGYLATLEGQKLPVEHCIEGTTGWMIDERLQKVIDGCVTIVNKPTFGSFDLSEIIKEDFQEDLEEIILCGFCTSICVLANAVLLRAKFPNTKITVMKNLCACVTEESHNAALKTMEMQQIEVQ